MDMAYKLEGHKVERIPPPRPNSLLITIKQAAVTTCAVLRGVTRPLPYCNTVMPGATWKQ